MAKLLKLRRGTTSQHSSFTGAEGEVTVDTDKETLVVHNGSTSGGFPVMSASGGTFTNTVTFAGDVTFDNATVSGADIAWDESAKTFRFEDTVKLALGDSSSQMDMYHDGSNAYIRNNTGNLAIEGKQGEMSIKCVPDAQVELYYNDILQTKTTSTGLSLGDSKRIDFGDGADCKIYHDGSHARIYNTTGNISFRSSNYRFNNAAGTENCLDIDQNGAVSLYYDHSKKLETASDKITFYAHAKVNANDTYDLGASGARWRNAYFSSHSYYGDSAEINLGASNDLQIWHKHSEGNNYIKSNTGALVINTDDLNIENKASSEALINADANGAVKLYYDGAQKIQTKSTGVYIQGSMGIEFENSYFMYPQSTSVMFLRSGSATVNSIALQTNGTTRGWINCNSSNEVGFLDADGQWAIKHIRDDATNFYVNNSQKAQINGNGLNVSGALSFNGGAGHYLTMADGQKIGIGNSNDMNLRHESGHTYIENNTGNLYIRTKTSEDGIIIEPDAGVKQFYDGNRIAYLSSVGQVIDTHKDIRMTSGNWTGDCGTGTAKIQCHSNHLYLCAAGGKFIFRQSNGAEWAFIESGGIIPAANNSFNLGSSSYRWANLYVNDAHFSNEGSSNSVDGTWGDWTLQEGEDDIFMLNNRSGKKYKMALTEVS